MKACILSLLSLLLLATNAMSQTAAEPYSLQWKKADSLLNRSLPESARKIVDKLYADAQRSNQPVQMLKAQLYRLRINGSSREGADSLNVAQAEEQASKAPFPQSAVWQSIAAQLYWNYYQQHRYEILQRTPARTRPAAPRADFEQWDAAEFVARSSTLYLQSIARAEELKRISIQAYDPVLKGEHTRSLRPTLFDLLAFRAIDFFENDEKDLTKPAFRFVMDDAAAFAPATAFIQHRFKTQDTTSMQYRALTLFQEVLRLHERDAAPDALLDADLQRLDFVYGHSVHPDKKALYIIELNRIEKSNVGTSRSAMASYKVASLLMGEDEEENSDDGIKSTLKKPQTDLRAVKARLDSIIVKYPESEGGISARQLLQSIIAPSLSITAEEAVLPNEPSRALVTYENVPRVYFRIVKMNSDDYRKGQNDNEAYIKTLFNAKPVQQFATALPGTEDYAEHSTEIKINALPPGMYAILVSTREDFKTDRTAVCYAVFQSTRLAVVTQADGNSKLSSYILDRKNGLPVSGAVVTYFGEKWNNVIQRYDYNNTPSVATKKDGSYRIGSNNDGYRGMTITNGKDTFYSKEYLSFSRNEEEKGKSEDRVFLFTDRSIYRPGQTIYFKGILVRVDPISQRTQVVPNDELLVTFYDVNSQKVDTTGVATNEWGSFSGKFIAPQTGLTGEMRIECYGAVANISVEEYKRPKFHIDWDTLKSDYTLNQTVAITGHAVAYAGNNVDGATVRYRVVRQVRWSSWWSFWRWGEKHSSQQEIIQGSTTTDASGKFIISFRTLPDLSIDSKSMPVFIYTIHTDITDLNGETRSGSRNIAAGDRSLQLNLTIPSQASRKELDSLFITTSNLNGDFVAANVALKLARLNQPEIIYRSRLWALPDQFTMSEREFRKSFPLDSYKDEDDLRNWGEAETVYERRITTTAAGNVSLPKGIFLRNGWYAITLKAKDKNGNSIEEKVFVNVWDATVPGSPYSVLFVTPYQQTAEPGSKVSISTVTGMNETHIIRQVQTMGGQIATTQHLLKENNTLLIWNKLLTEADRGGVALSFIAVKDNRIYIQSAKVNVPWTNKDLNIEWATHRDKLQPGAAETWTMIVRGAKKDKVAAELAAVLYDASLDAIKPQEWSIPRLFPDLNARINWEQTIGFGKADGSIIGSFTSPPLPYYNKTYDHLIFLGRYIELNRRIYPSISVKNRRMLAKSANGTSEEEQIVAPLIDAENPGGRIVKTVMVVGKIVHDSPPKDEPIFRKNLQETAFFYPQLQTDAEGAVRIQFTIPEALTEWKLLAFAHTKDMRTGYTTGSVKTQKDLMVQPGLPRFLRQGDEITLSTKIVNLSNAAMSGTATLEIIDAVSGKPLPVPFRIVQTSVAFTAQKGGSTNATWTIHVPESIYEPVIIRIRAKAGAFTDGEENTLPVLTNRMLVTETMPLWMNGSGTKTFSFEKLLRSGSAADGQVQGAVPTLAQHRLTVEYTANPAWLAIQALPYLMEFPHECAEQTFNRYYANALAAHILDKAPKVKAIFRKWEEEALLSSFLSPLEQNEELKSALLEETPWVLDAQNEREQRKNITLLFQTAKLAHELDKAAKKLEDMMLPEGGWPWFKGDTRPDRYITQYIVTGIGRLKKLGITNTHLDAAVAKALTYMDREMVASIYRTLDRKVNELYAGYIDFQYLYARSFFGTPDLFDTKTSFAFYSYESQAEAYWSRFNPYVKGMIAVALHRRGMRVRRRDDFKTSATIIQSLRETSIQKEETGMYWMEPGRSWYWWEAPVEAQSLLIECFGEVAKDKESVDKMKRWLLKQKQTQNWPTTKATADACYALLLQGSQWLNSEPQVSIQLGDKTIRSQDMKGEAGTGYFKVQYPGAEVKPDMGNIILAVSNTSNVQPPTSNQPSWGAVYWQYFENLDKITSAATPLAVKKQLFIERNTDHGPELRPIAPSAGGGRGEALQVGDKVKVRIEIIVDRDMEYVHLKDGRASCFEPTNVLSGYRWQGGLGYYESTRDASSNFFFSYLPKGKYVFEYPMFVTNAGNYSAGLATIQCMYAPEFSAHSEGIRVVVK